MTMNFAHFCSNSITTMLHRGTFGLRENTSHSDNDIPIIIKRFGTETKVFLAYLKTAKELLIYTTLKVWSLQHGVRGNPRRVVCNTNSSHLPFMSWLLAWQIGVRSPTYQKPLIAVRQPDNRWHLITEGITGTEVEFVSFQRYILDPCC